MKNLKYIIILLLLTVIVVELSHKVTSTVDEVITIERYVREHIKELSPLEPVLGGSWYVVSVEVNSEDNKGIVVYEDGHIQESREFNYSLDDGGKLTSLVLK